MENEKTKMFVLRTWEEGATHAWRASLLNVETQQKQYFAEPTQLTQYLEQMVHGNHHKIIAEEH